LTTLPFALSDCQTRKLACVMDAACDELPRRYRPDCCIAAARVLIDVFAELHVRARPLAVSVDVFNPPFVQRAEANGGRLPATTEEYQSWTAECGAWWLTLGHPASEPQPGKWPGHVVVVAWESILIDLSLPQAGRPERGINLVPLVVQVRPDDLDGTGRRVVDCNGCELHYLARPDDRTFLAAPDWQDRRRHEPTVREILARVRAELRRG
jgi:hypothetical protein